MDWGAGMGCWFPARGRVDVVREDAGGVRWPKVGSCGWVAPTFHGCVIPAAVVVACKSREGWGWMQVLCDFLLSVDAG